MHSYLLQPGVLDGPQHCRDEEVEPGQEVPCEGAEGVSGVISPDGGRRRRRRREALEAHGVQGVVERVGARAPQPKVLREKRKKSWK